jgi:hypothetical protein
MKLATHAVLEAVWLASSFPLTGNGKKPRQRSPK